MLKQIFTLTSEELGYTLNSLGYRLSNNGKPMRKVLVNGSPKTGTTWLLKMIASIPGYHAIGNFDGEIQRYHAVQPGEVVHGHDPFTPELDKILADNQIGVVLTVRDPRDQLVSRVFHIRRDTTHAWHGGLTQLSLEDAILACIEGRPGLQNIRSMIELTQSWLSGRSQALPVKYEEMLHNTPKEFSRVVNHLGLNVSPGLVQAIVSRNRFERLTVGRKFWQRARKQGEADPNSHFRKGIEGDWKNHLKPDHITRLKEVAGDKLIELGYEKDFNW